jgi:hypothetical protein
MTLHSEIGIHLYLTRGMARRFGVDLTVAMHEGLLSRRDFAELITRCRLCEAGPALCYTALATPVEAPASPPDYCASRDLLIGIRDLTRKAERQDQPGCVTDGTA